MRIVNAPYGVFMFRSFIDGIKKQLYDKHAEQAFSVRGKANYV